jgi:hypothetical protein
MAGADFDPLSVAWPILLAGESAGNLITITARLDGELMGYALFWLFPSPHHAGEKRAQCDALYLCPWARVGNLGRDLITTSNRLLGSMGVRAVMHSVRPGRPFGPLLTRLGFRPLEQIYIARID